MLERYSHYLEQLPLSIKKELSNFILLNINNYTLEDIFEQFDIILVFIRNIRMYRLHKLSTYNLDPLTQQLVDTFLSEYEIDKIYFLNQDSCGFRRYYQYTYVPSDYKHPKDLYKIKDVFSTFKILLQIFTAYARIEGINPNLFKRLLLTFGKNLLLIQELEFKKSIHYSSFTKKNINIQSPFLLCLNCNRQDMNISFREQKIFKVQCKCCKTIMSVTLYNSDTNIYTILRKEEEDIYPIELDEMEDDEFGF